MLMNQFDPKQEWPVVIYARMSSDKQNPRSPDQQIAVVNELLKRLGYPWKVVAVYRDDAISGRYTRKRPQLQQMLRDLKSGAVKAKLVLVDTYERLSRADDGTDLRNQLRRMGILVLTADSGFADPTSTSGMALSMVEAIRANADGRVKAHNVLRGKKDSLRQKHWPGGPVPFGYRLKNVMVVRRGVEEVDYRVLEPDPQARWIVAEAFRLAAEKGWGTSRIAKQLNAEPRISQSLKPFQASTIGTWLDNEIYYGELVWGKNCTGIVNDVRVVQSLPEEDWERIPEFCEPLVSRDVWDQVQALREERRRRGRKARASSRSATAEVPGLRVPGIALKYILSGLVRCQECGRSMAPSSSAVYRTKAGEERRYVSYYCPGHATGVCTNGRGIPEKWLRETVVALIRQRLFLDE